MLIDFSNRQASNEARLRIILNRHLHPLTPPHIELKIRTKRRIKEKMIKQKLIK